MEVKYVSLRYLATGAGFVTLSKSTGGFCKGMDMVIDEKIMCVQKSTKQP